MLSHVQAMSVEFPNYSRADTDLAQGEPSKVGIAQAPGVLVSFVT